MTVFNRWIPGISQTFPRKSAVAFAGVAVAGMAVAGPIGSGGHDAPTPATSTAVSTAAKPTQDVLIPHGTEGKQVSAPLGSEQRDNAGKIVEATKQAGLDERAAVIAVGTALQESKLTNYGHLGDRNDHDSQGLFQQRPSAGWGTVEQITDPQYSTKAFLDGLEQVDGWEEMPLTDAAQKVQVSAYPQAYAQWESQAADLVAEYWSN